MTDHKHRKARVRARMARTGERYATARTHVVAGGETSTAPRHATDATALRPGTNPAAAALRILLDDVGATMTESLALVIGGGIGMGVFQFHYAKVGVSSFFLAGRHRWDDDEAFLRAALDRLGLTPRVTETTSTTIAERHLREALTSGRPVVAWVDLAELGTRAYPPGWSGGGYHVVVVRSIHDARRVAILDDLAAVPVEVPLDVLARARARITKARNRLLWLAAETDTPTGDRIDAALRAGLRATVAGFDRPRTRSFSLDALTDWAARLRGSGKDSWATVFPPGGRLWTALAAIHEEVEHFGSGGGLVRPAFAAGLREASVRLLDDGLATVADRYDELGIAWSALATAALPDGIPAFRRTRDLQDRRATAYAAAGADARDDLAAAWDELATLRAEVDDCYPVGPDGVRAHLDELATRAVALHDEEVAALHRLRTVLG